MSQSLHAPLSDDSPNEENDDGADDRADQTGAFPWRIPAERLPEIAGNDSAYDAQDCCQDEAGGRIFTRHDELGDYSGDKPDYGHSDDSHRLLFEGFRREPGSDMTIHPGVVARTQRSRAETFDGVDLFKRKT